jgi:hypothetical protein
VASRAEPSGTLKVTAPSPIGLNECEGVCEFPERAVSQPYRVGRDRSEGVAPGFFLNQSWTSAFSADCCLLRCAKLSIGADAFT